MNISPYGLINISISELLSLEFAHFYTDIDVDNNLDKVSQCGQSTDISGYTEWVSLSNPKISIGWDWTLTNNIPVQWKRIGFPRTNVLLRNVGESTNTIADQVWQDNLNNIATVIDALPWQEVLPKYLSN